MMRMFVKVGCVFVEILLLALVLTFVSTTLLLLPPQTMWSRLLVLHAVLMGLIVPDPLTLALMVPVHVVPMLLAPVERHSVAVLCA